MWKLFFVIFKGYVSQDHGEKMDTGKKKKLKISGGAGVFSGTFFLLPSVVPAMFKRTLGDAKKLDFFCVFTLEN